MGSGTERNKSCPCGSGRKTKVCCQGRKPIQKTITFDFGTPKEVIGITLSASGAVFMKTSDGATPISAVHADMRSRDKGSKYLTRVPVRVDEANIYESVPALCKYKTIYVIDTNSHVIEEKIISVSCLMMCSVEKRDDLNYTVQSVPVAVFEIHECSEKPENFAVMILQSMIMSGEGYKEDDLFAIVNDSDLGNYQSFNDRSLPIYGDVCLLPNISLLYASADTGSSILNSLMKQCDNLAARAMGSLLTAGLKQSVAKRVRSGPCTRFQLHFIPFQGPMPYNWQSLGTNLPLRPNFEDQKSSLSDIVEKLSAR